MIEKYLGERKNFPTFSDKHLNFPHPRKVSIDELLIYFDRFFQSAWKIHPIETVFNLANVEVDPETLISLENFAFFR
jgi:hypothetical protein